MNDLAETKSNEICNLAKTQRKIAARERERQAVNLRKTGATFDAIAKSLGVSPGGAYKIVQRALKRIVEDYRHDGECVRALELLRLDKMSKKLWKQLRDQNSAPELIQGAIDKLLKIQDRRAKYLGLDIGKPFVVDPLMESKKALNPILKGATFEELLILRTQFLQITQRKNGAEEGQEYAKIGPENNIPTNEPENDTQPNDVGPPNGPGNGGNGIGEKET